MKCFLKVIHNTINLIANILLTLAVFLSYFLFYCDALKDYLMLNSIIIKVNCNPMDPRFLPTLFVLYIFSWKSGSHTYGILHIKFFNFLSFWNVIIVRIFRICVVDCSPMLTYAISCVPFNYVLHTNVNRQWIDERLYGSTSILDVENNP